MLKMQGVNFPIDLGAEKLIAAEKENEKIVVKIKSFLTESVPNEFHTALGQYLDYALGLEEQEPDRLIYLAMPDKIHQRIQKIPILQKALNRYNVRVILFEPSSEIIKQWILN